MSDKESKYKHTAGPWKVTQGNNYNCEISAKSKRGISKVVARLASFFKGEEGKANARLIAAAPELLELTVALLSAIEIFAITNTSNEDAIGVLSDAARAAITKATGAE